MQIRSTLLILFLACLIIPLASTMECNLNCEDCSIGRCTRCSTGYGVTLSGYCTICPPGTYSNNGNSCAACAAGTFSSNFGTLLCQNCPEGYTSLMNNTNCSFCDEGYYMESGQCTVCPAGTYSGLNATSCSACPTSTVSPPGSTHCFGYCPYGLVQVGSKCLPPSQASNGSVNTISSGSDSISWFYIMFGLLVLCLFGVIFLFVKISSIQKQGKMGLEGTSLGLITSTRNEIL